VDLLFFLKKALIMYSFDKPNCSVTLVWILNLYFGRVFQFPSDFFTKIRNKTYKITLTDSYNIHSSFEQCVFDIIASHRERSGVVARRERTRDVGRPEN